MINYEICYLGGRYGSKRSYKFRITQITEIDNPSLPGLVLQEKDFPVPPTLTFGHCPIKNLQIGDYLNVETTDGKLYTNFQRCLHPDKPMDAKLLRKASAEETAHMLEKRALNASRLSTKNTEYYIVKLKNAMSGLNLSQRRAFALYVHQTLLK
jgi:hypothetical protein